MRHLLPLRTYGTNGKSTGEAVVAPATMLSPSPGCHARDITPSSPGVVADSYITTLRDYKHPTINLLKTRHTRRGFNDNQTIPVREKDEAALPSISDLLHLAVTQTDFVGDLDPATLEANCANSIDLAADIWSDAHGTVTVPLSLIQWARCALLLEAEAMLRDREAHAEAERLDAIEAGDLSADGEFVPYPTYRSV